MKLTVTLMSLFCSGCMAGYILPVRYEPYTTVDGSQYQRPGVPTAIFPIPDYVRNGGFRNEHLEVADPNSFRNYPHEFHNPETQYYVHNNNNKEYTEHRFDNEQSGPDAMKNHHDEITETTIFNQEQKLTTQKEENKDDKEYVTDNTERVPQRTSTEITPSSDNSDESHNIESNEPYTNTYTDVSVDTAHTNPVTEDNTNSEDKDEYDENSSKVTEIGEFEKEEEANNSQASDPSEVTDTKTELTVTSPSPIENTAETSSQENIIVDITKSSDTSSSIYHVVAFSPHVEGFEIIHKSQDPVSQINAEPPHDEEPKTLEDLLKNKQFWDWIGDWSAAYSVLIKQNIKNEVKEEMSRQMAHFTAQHEPKHDIDKYYLANINDNENYKNKENSNNLHKSRLTDHKAITNDRTEENPLSGVHEENPNKNYIDNNQKQPSPIIEARNIFGNFLDSNNVTNVFIFVDKKETDINTDSLNSDLETVTEGIFGIDERKGYSNETYN